LNALTILLRVTHTVHLFKQIASDAFLHGIHHELLITGKFLPSHCDNVLYNVVLLT